MFIVTIEAEEKLEESLQEQTADSEVAIFISKSLAEMQLLILNKNRRTQ